MNARGSPRRAPRAPGASGNRRPLALARALVPRPARGTRLAELALGDDGVSAFRRLVRTVLPEHEATIMAADHDAGEGREAARVEAFLDRIEALFPLETYPGRYRELLGGIPFRCEGWWDEGQELSCLPVGELLMLAVVADPYDAGFHGALDEYLPSLGIPSPLLEARPGGGATPDELAARFVGTRWEAVAGYAAWIHARTGIVFLDWSPGDGPFPLPWTRENVALLTAQAAAAQRLLRAIDELATWLGAAPAARFAELVAALGDARAAGAGVPELRAEPESATDSSR